VGPQNPDIKTGPVGRRPCHRRRWRWLAEGGGRSGSRAGPDVFVDAAVVLMLIGLLEKAKVNLTRAGSEN
jgi:hypothetical protein